MSDLICSKTMRQCQTPSMCTPFGGCIPEGPKQAEPVCYVRPAELENLKHQSAKMILACSDVRGIFGEMTPLFTFTPSSQAEIDRLTRELAAKDAVIADRDETIQVMGLKLAHAEAEIAGMRKDKKRMDWLENQGMIGIHHTQYGEYRLYAGEPFKPIREVIDAAIAE